MFVYFFIAFAYFRLFHLAFSYNFDDFHKHFRLFVSLRHKQNWKKIILPIEIIKNDHINLSFSSDYYNWNFYIFKDMAKTVKFSRWFDFSRSFFKDFWVISDLLALQEYKISPAVRFNRYFVKVIALYRISTNLPRSQSHWNLGQRVLLNPYS